jgi:hypothetical protein
MFPLPYSRELSTALYALAGLNLTLLVSGLALGKLSQDGTGRLPRPLRMTLSGILVLAALLGWLWGARGTPIVLYAAVIFFGMAAGFLGDLIMARLIPVPNRLVFGMIAFGVGHVLYSAAFLLIALQFGLNRTHIHLLILAPLLLFSLWVWLQHIRKPGGSRAINAGSLVYGVLIAIMTTLALALAAQNQHLFGLGLGAVLFLVSDLTLGNWQVRGHVWKSVNDVIWTAYVIGQLLIVHSVAAALNMLR